MLPNIRVFPNGDGTYTLLLDFLQQDVEFAEEFYHGQNQQPDFKDLKKRIMEQAQKFKITSVKILVSGALVAPSPSPPCYLHLPQLTGIPWAIFMEEQTCSKLNMWNRQAMLWIRSPPATLIYERTGA